MNEYINQYHTIFHCNKFCRIFQDRYAHIHDIDFVFNELRHNKKN